jgi:nitric oxide reductase NorD protein
VAHAEDLLFEGARRASVVARELWWRARPPEARREVPLTRVRRRLDLVVTALCGVAPPIVPADPPPPPTWLARVFGNAPRHLDVRAAVAATDGTRIWLPRTIAVEHDDEAAVRLYRLLAVEQAARVARGIASWIPADRFERDLYLLSEAAAIDEALVRTLPGLAADLRTARAHARRARPGAPLRALERVVEDMVREVLGAEPASPPSWLPVRAAPVDSAAWARRIAGERRQEGDGYRGVPGVALWGDVVAESAASTTRPVMDEPVAEGPRRPRSASLRYRPRARRAAEDEDDERPGTWMIRPDEPMESAEDPMGLQRPADHDDDAKAADLADALSDLPEARVVRTPGRPREVLESDDGVSKNAAAASDAALVDAGIVYPEWDYRQNAYRQRGAVVRVRQVAPGSGAWVDDVLRRHAMLVRRVRRRFDALRPRRVRVSRQVDGHDVDLTAYVTAFADRLAHQGSDDRLYTATRPARRDLVLALLIDASASTDSWVSGALRVIDVEKEAVVVLLEALDALGDRHAVLAFSGEGPRDVRVGVLKDFDERGSLESRRRVAALEPDGYTRAGAAIRHATAMLSREAARHRLLLILSDGKPNDVDAYDGRYGIADTRQAVAEARLQGIAPFCLTVDREAPAYLPSIFGRGGYAMLPRQDILPAVLVDVVRRLLAS